MSDTAPQAIRTLLANMRREASRHMRDANNYRTQAAISQGRYEVASALADDLEAAIKKEAAND